jgi:hypothetical protein
MSLRDSTAMDARVPRDRLLRPEHGDAINFTGMSAKSKSEHARRWQKLLIGPWGHGVPTTDRVSCSATSISVPT